MWILSLITMFWGSLFFGARWFFKWLIPFYCQKSNPFYAFTLLWKKNILYLDIARGCRVKQQWICKVFSYMKLNTLSVSQHQQCWKEIAVVKHISFFFWNECVSHEYTVVWFCLTLYWLLHPAEGFRGYQCELYIPMSKSGE